MALDWQKNPGGKRYSAAPAKGHEIRLIKQNTAAGGPAWTATHLQGGSDTGKRIAAGSSFKEVKQAAENHWAAYDAAHRKHDLARIEAKGLIDLAKDASLPRKMAYMAVHMLDTHDVTWKNGNAPDFHVMGLIHAAQHKNGLEAPHTHAAGMTSITEDEGE